MTRWEGKGEAKGRGVVRNVCLIFVNYRCGGSKKKRLRPKAWGKLRILLL